MYFLCIWKNDSIRCTFVRSSNLERSKLDDLYVLKCILKLAKNGCKQPKMFGNEWKRIEIVENGPKRKNNDHNRQKWLNRDFLKSCAYRKTWQPQNWTTSKLDDRKTRQPQNSTTPKIDNPKPDDPKTRSPNFTIPKLDDPKTWWPQNDNPKTQWPRNSKTLKLVEMNAIQLALLYTDQGRSGTRH